MFYEKNNYQNCRILMHFSSKPIRKKNRTLNLFQFPRKSLYKYSSMLV
jgi:hypothetical protein